jgi:hypothetical protein
MVTVSPRLVLATPLSELRTGIMDSDICSTRKIHELSGVNGLGVNKKLRSYEIILKLRP